MKQFSKSWLLLLICGAVLVLASILVLIKADNVVNLLVYIAGFALLALGVVLCIMAFAPSRKDERGQLLLFALGNAALGVIIMLASNIFMLLVGLAIALNGVGVITEAVHLKKLDSERWMRTLLVGIGFTLLGIVVAIFYQAITAALGVSIGLALLVLGITFIIFALLARKNSKNGLA